MPRGPRNLRPSDITTAVKAVEKAGKNVARVEVDPDGKITIFVACSETAAAVENPWETQANENLAARSKL